MCVCPLSYLRMIRIYLLSTLKCINLNYFSMSKHLFYMFWNHSLEIENHYTVISLLLSGYVEWINIQFQCWCIVMCFYLHLVSNLPKWTWQGGRLYHKKHCCCSKCVRLAVRIVLALCILWSGLGAEFGSGILEWSGVEWSQSLEWQADCSCLNGQQNHIGTSTLVYMLITCNQTVLLSLSFDFFICPVIFYDEKSKNICHSKIWLHSTSVLHSKIGLTEPTILDLIRQTYHSLVFNFVICPVIFYNENYKSSFYSNTFWLHSTPILHSKAPLQDSTAQNTQCRWYSIGDNFDWATSLDLLAFGISGVFYHRPVAGRILYRWQCINGLTDHTAQ